MTLRAFSAFRWRAALVIRAYSAINKIANNTWGSTLPVGAALLLASCATLQDAPRLTFMCPSELRFEARLYQDMALLEGLRGHAVLERVAGAVDDSGAAALVYADSTVRAQFGLGVGGRLARLDYTGIPEPVYCERAVTPRAGEPPSVEPTPRPGPRPPPPRPDPNAPVPTNIRLGDGNNGPG